jgi:hypothetical protein
MDHAAAGGRCHVLTSDEVGGSSPCAGAPGRRKKRPRFLREAIGIGIGVAIAVAIGFWRGSW